MNRLIFDQLWFDAETDPSRRGVIPRAWGVIGMSGGELFLYLYRPQHSRLFWI